MLSIAALELSVGAMFLRTRLSPLGSGLVCLRLKMNFVLFVGTSISSEVSFQSLVSSWNSLSLSFSETISHSLLFRNPFLAIHSILGS